MVSKRTVVASAYIGYYSKRSKKLKRKSVIAKNARKERILAKMNVDYANEHGGIDNRNVYDDDEIDTQFCFKFNIDGSFTCCDCKERFHCSLQAQRMSCDEDTYKKIMAETAANMAKYGSHEGVWARTRETRKYRTSKKQ